MVAGEGCWMMMLRCMLPTVRFVWRVGCIGQRHQVVETVGVVVALWSAGAAGMKSFVAGAGRDGLLGLGLVGCLVGGTLRFRMFGLSGDHDVRCPCNPGSLTSLWIAGELNCLCSL